MGGVLSWLENLQKGFCPPCKKEWGDYIHVEKNMGVIMSTYTKTGRGDFVREGFCPAPVTLQYSTSNTLLLKSCHQVVQVNI